MVRGNFPRLSSDGAAHLRSGCAPRFGRGSLPGLSDVGGLTGCSGGLLVDKSHGRHLGLSGSRRFRSLSGKLPRLSGGRPGYLCCSGSMRLGRSRLPRLGHDRLARPSFFGLTGGSGGLLVGKRGRCHLNLSGS